MHHKTKNHTTNPHQLMTPGRPKTQPALPTRPDCPPRRRLVDLAAAGAYLGVCTRTVSKLKSTNQLPYVQIGRSVRFDLNALDEFVAKHSRGGE